MNVQIYCSETSVELGGCDARRLWPLPRLVGHDAAWLDAVANGLRHRAFRLVARRGEAIVGYLPLVLVRGPIFGKFMVSLPYINTGGVMAADEEVAAALVDQACELADVHQVRYLELRHEVPVEHPRLNFRRTEKVHMRLMLPDSDDALERSFKSKLRSQIRKAGESNPVVCWGHRELLRDFYHVFSVNMRDLGTPVFSRGLFAEILQAFGSDAEFCVLYRPQEAGVSRRVPMAAALLVHRHGKTEVPSASCLREFNPTGANMWMYRHLLRRAVERGSASFDFGRSSGGSGTYKFKEQWGATPHPAVWQYYVRQGSVDQMRPDSQSNQRLIRIWQKLPVWLTRLCGPEIVRGIP